ncbi:MAG: hypothetical protein WCK88_01810 [bacterium]
MTFPRILPVGAPHSFFGSGDGVVGVGLVAKNGFFGAVDGCAHVGFGANL